jgi:S-DNA-T family DNA segregation ATPase FtsK/SpoIIIE
VAKAKRDFRKAPSRTHRIDGAAWLLLVAGLVVALCVFSFDARTGADLLGPMGARLARELFDTLGLAVHVLLASWFVLVLLLLLRRSWLTWTLRLAGWLALLPCAAVVADWYGPELFSASRFGSGGAVGYLLHIMLDANFTPLGKGIVFGSALALGLLLALDFLVLGVLNVAWMVCKSCGAVAAAVLRYLLGNGSSRRRRLEVASPAEGADGFDTIPINHSGVKTIPDEVLPELRVDEPEPAILPIQRNFGTPAEDEHRFDNYELPPMSLLSEPEPFPFEEHDQKLRDTAALLEQTFKDFDLNIRVVGINTGPVITQYEVALETGMRVNKVTTLADDLALHLRVPSVRVVAPIPGKNTVGIEVPNEHRATVRLKDVLQTAGRKLAKMKLPLFLGKDTEGRPLIYDLADMPHLLIAGSTGTGKSVCMNAIIVSTLMTRRPDEVKMIMIDPKMTELTEYGKIPHMMHPVVKDMKKAEAILAWAVDKMEERYDLLSRARVRHISVYNELGMEEILRRLQPDEDEKPRIPEKMPYIVILVDELNDLMMLLKREVEGHIIRLAQKSRAAGIHLVLATQKPTVDVITGLIKSNLPGRICFKVASRTDSRVVLDEMGADKLLGKGDMLFLQPGTSTLIRAQGTYAGDEEITRVVAHLECDQPCYAAELVQLKPSNESGSAMERMKARDELYEQAIEIVVREGRGSVSLLQRALGIGYGRAARLIDFMAEDGIVGAYNGASAREVLYTPEEWVQLKQGAQAARA